MHIQTHIMSGWCFGNLFGLGTRERTLCIIAGSVYDLDGLGLLFGLEAYWKYHHILGHNILAGLLICSLLTVFSNQRLRGFIAYFALFHIHIAMDYLGSGPGWTISYFLPFSQISVENPYAWEFHSWQNIGTAVLFLLWTVAIIFVCRRTPLELAMSSLDRQIVNLSRRITEIFRLVFKNIFKP